jgi:hypothetical protein
LLEGGRVYYRFLKGEAVRILEKVMRAEPGVLNRGLFCGKVSV